MKIKEITIYKSAISFKKPFGHNLASRNSSDGIIVKVISGNGIAGYGEGLPRTYVTGETQDISVKRIIDEYIDLFTVRDYGSSEEVFRAFHEYTPERDKQSGIFPGAALCAVEAALLDLFSKADGKPVYSIAGSRKAESVNYSAVLSTGNYAKLIKALIKFRLYGFKQVKVKVTDGSDIRNVKLTRSIMGKDCSIRADANMAWDFEQAVEYTEMMARSGLDGIEEPIKDNSIENICLLQERINVPIIVDEAFASYDDGLELIKAGFKGIFNLRLSKCGGFAQCLKLYKLAEENGLLCKMGCQVGESAILSALGRHFAVLHPGLVFLEGSYGIHILREDISREDIRFSYGGKALPLENPGLGVDIIDSKIESFCEKVYNKRF